MARRDEDDDDDDDGDVKQYVVTGEELKKLVRLGRKRPMPFAFCPSNGEDESLFATHRKKSAKKIGKATKADSGQLKVAYGTFVIVDRVMVLTCQKELPSIAKRLKKHMRAERLPLNIRVLDASGKEIESDIEELSAEMDPFAGIGEDDDEGGEPQGTGDRLRDRLAELGPIVGAARGIEGDRLRDLWAAAVRASENGSRDKAHKLLALVEKDARRLTNSAARTGPAETARPPAPKPTAAPAEDPEDQAEARRREVLRQARRVAALRPRLAALPAPAAGRIAQALAIVVRQLRAEDPEGAAAALDRIEAALDRVAAQAGP
jgi:hypothetical protein